jgi:Hypothetical protein (DUF2513)
MATVITSASSGPPGERMSGGLDAHNSINIALDPNGRVLMTRNMELIRKIILAIQARQEVVLVPLEIPGVDPAILARHVEMLLDAGLIEGVKLGGYNAPLPTIQIKDLSWAGHEFASALGNDNVWSKIKQQFSGTEIVKMPFSVLKDVGIGILTEMAKQQAGLS